LLSNLSSNPNSLFSIAQTLRDYYAPILREVYYEDFPKREKDLENFISITANYTTIESILSDLALDPIDLSAMETKPTQHDESPLVLSTIHSAKGLEWQSVFLINALDGTIPSKFAVGDSQSLDEELRLMYVALTRAKNLLYACYPIIVTSRGDDDYFGNPSRFLQNLPENLFEKMILVEEKTTSKQLPAPPKLLAGKGEINELPF
jgi:DNA helicase-2/ATP-dependent DNA helicase PcrA